MNGDYHVIMSCCAITSSCYHEGNDNRRNDKRAVDKDFLAPMKSTKRDRRREDDDDYDDGDDDDDDPNMSEPTMLGSIKLLPKIPMMMMMMMMMMMTMATVNKKLMMLRLCDYYKHYSIS